MIGMNDLQLIAILFQLARNDPLLANRQLFARPAAIAPKKGERDILPVCINPHDPRRRPRAAAAFVITDYKADDDILPDIGKIDHRHRFSINPVCGKMVDQVFHPFEAQLGQRLGLTLAPRLLTFCTSANRGLRISGRMARAIYSADARSTHYRTGHLWTGKPIAANCTFARTIAARARPMPLSAAFSIRPMIGGTQKDFAWFERVLEEQDVDIMGWALGTIAIPAEFEGPMMDEMAAAGFCEAAGWVGSARLISMPELSTIISAKTPLTLSSVPTGFTPLLLADLARAAKGRTLFIAADDAEMRMLADTVPFFAGELEILQFPAWDCLPYDRASPSLAVTSRADGDAQSLAEAD